MQPGLLFCCIFTVLLIILIEILLIFTIRSVLTIFFDFAYTNKYSGIHMNCFASIKVTCIFYRYFSKYFSDSCILFLTVNVRLASFAV